MQVAAVSRHGKLMASMFMVHVDSGIVTVVVVVCVWGGGRLHEALKKKKSEGNFISSNVLGRK